MKFIGLASFVGCAAFRITALVLSPASGVLAGFKASDSDCIQSRDNSQDIRLYNDSNAISLAIQAISSQGIAVNDNST